MALDWDSSFTPDATLAGLSTPGLVPAGADQAGDLKDQSGRVATQVSFDVSARIAGQEFDPRKLYVGWLKDAGGGAFETPGPTGQGQDTNLQPVGSHGLPTIPSRVGAFVVPAQEASGFRAYFRNMTDIDLIIAANYKQA